MSMKMKAMWKYIETAALVFFFFFFSLWIILNNFDLHPEQFMEAQNSACGTAGKNVEWILMHSNNLPQAFLSLKNPSAA